MIVTCEECSTSFQLDEARIPASGARVRCSRCKHAFFLPNPSASQSEAIDSIAEEAAGDTLASVPTPEPDLSSTGLGDALGGSADAALAAAGEEEEDWEFSEEIRNEGDEEPDFEDDASSSGVFGTGLDVGDAESEGFRSDELESEAVGEAADTAGPGIEEARDESDFGSVDDFSSLMEEDDDASLDLAGEIESEMEIEEAPVATSSVYASAGSTDDLGDPESWDLVGNDEFAVAGSASASASAPASLLGASEGVDDAYASGSDGPFYEEEIGPASMVHETLASVGRGLGWVVTLAMVGAVLGLGLQAEWNRGDQKAQIVSAGGLTAQTTNSNWVATSRSGYVLLVEGQLRNDGSTALWPGTLQLALLDHSGARLLTEEPHPAGVPLPELILREGTPDELRVAAQSAARSFRASPLAPGETRAFVAVALEDRIPEVATRFLLEMSDPGRVTNVAAPAPAPRPDADPLPLEDQSETPSALQEPPAHSAPPTAH